MKHEVCYVLPDTLPGSIFKVKRKHMMLCAAILQSRRDHQKTQNKTKQNWNMGAM